MPEDHFQYVYHNRAADYEALIAREDYQGNISRALNQIRSPDGLDIVEMGTGTGRLTRLLASSARRVIATDASREMLKEAAAVLATRGITNVRLVVADNRQLPLPDQCADIAIEGWSFGHLTGWYLENWRIEMGKALHEMKRVLKPGGTAILLETMGTGQEMPQPPTEELAAFYTMLEQDYGFRASWIRTDFQFESVEEAAYLVRFFFGEENNALADQIVAENLTILPECTGIWSLTV